MAGKLMRYTDQFKKYSETTLKGKSRYDLIGIIQTGYYAYDRDKAFWKKQAENADELTMEWIDKVYDLKAQLEAVRKELEETKKKLDALEADPVGKPKGGRPRTYTDESRKKVEELHRQGLTIRKIAVAVQMSPATVSRIIKALPSIGQEST